MIPSRDTYRKPLGSSQVRERSPGEEFLMYAVRESGAIGYYERNGQVFFACHESFHEGRRFWRYESFGQVPANVCARGTSAIRAYAEAEVAKDIVVQRERHEKFDRFAKNPDFPLTFRYHDVTLSGRVVSADGPLVVRLDQPYQGEARLNYGFASAMSGRYILSSCDDEPCLSEDAMESAKGMLVEIFHRERHREEHKETIALVDALNRP